jgi:hypothetical protein
MYRRLIFVEEYIFEMMKTKIECCAIMSKRKIGADRAADFSDAANKNYIININNQNTYFIKFKTNKSSICLTKSKYQSSIPNTYYSSSSIFSKIQIPIKDISLKQNIVIKFKKTNKHKL